MIHLYPGGFFSCLVVVFWQWITIDLCIILYLIHIYTILHSVILDSSQHLKWKRFNFFNE